jgi:GNAT superfamily N-acetyltransferase
MFSKLIKKVHSTKIEWTFFILPFRPDRFLKPVGSLQYIHGIKSKKMHTPKIINYEPKHQPAFKSLNEAWISKYFKMEPQDYAALDNPHEKILKHGGAILMVLFSGEIVGTCALIKMSETRYELAKMAIDPSVQGKKLGFLLGLAIIEKAKAMGGTSLYIESNTHLIPAIRLYRKLGFVEMPRTESPYARCNIQMELLMDN